MGQRPSTLAVELFYSETRACSSINQSIQILQEPHRLHPSTATPPTSQHRLPHAYGQPRSDAGLGGLSTLALHIELKLKYTGSVHWAGETSAGLKKGPMPICF